MQGGVNEEPRLVMNQPVGSKLIMGVVSPNQGQAQSEIEMTGHQQQQQEEMQQQQ